MEDAPFFVNRNAGLTIRRLSEFFCRIVRKDFSKRQKNEFRRIKPAWDSNEKEPNDFRLEFEACICLRKRSLTTVANYDDKALSLQITIFLPDAPRKALQAFFLTCHPQALLEKSSLSLTFPFYPLFASLLFFLVLRLLPAQSALQRTERLWSEEVCLWVAQKK